MQTPCIHVCSIDPETGLCMGCGRTLPEIGGWMSFCDEERRQLIAILPARLAASRLAIPPQPMMQATAEQRA
ncbi:putative Fe-S protein YdhL (DUF1289 family) [Rhizobium tibeticum]|uniref:DUF1289 domain-containing protein n=1 Tax=Rhizobium tibeticum TaxID=501024 RepID=UPI00277E9092|nr:DUF1289 domain-containing protein [Rhizobium tibeticum]MDP9809083.1 putative Fe-S protein YdhL (DUF1289 family) [Rhizobium tibeticum]